MLRTINIIYGFVMHHRSIPTQDFNIDLTDQIRLEHWVVYNE